jgi:uncharacterized protein (TIGR03435 family)
MRYRFHRVRRLAHAAKTAVLRSMATIASAVVLTSPWAHAQTDSHPPLQFEVASIKPTDPARVLRSMELPLNNGRLTIRGLTLKQLVQYAWGNVGVGDGLHESLISGGTGWVNRDRFDVVAKSGGAQVPSRADRRQMLRSLLIEQFQLKFHNELRPTPVYILVVAKTGPRMKPRRPDDGGPPFSLPFNGLHISGKNVPMPALVDVLQAMIPMTDSDHESRPVVDRTRLTGTFDLELAWSGDETFSGGRGGASPEPAGVPDLFTAVQEQLGLRLLPRKIPMEILVIDHAAPPDVN